MQTVISIALNDLRVFTSDRGNLVSLFVIPVIFTLVLGAALGGGGGSADVRVDVIDMSHTPLSEQFLTSLKDVNATLNLCPLDDADGFCHFGDIEDFDEAVGLTQEQALDRIENGITSALIVIPADFEAALSDFSPVSIDYYAPPDAAFSDAVLQSVQTALGRLNGTIIAARVGTELATALDIETEGIANAVYENASASLAEEAVGVRYVLTEEGEQSSAGGGFSQSVPGMGTMFTLFTALTGMALLLRERKQWTLQRMIVMPVSRAQLIGGKILARFLTSLTTFVVLIIVGVFVGVDYGNNLLLILIIVMAYTLCVTALTFAIAPLVKSEMQANSISNLVGLSLAALGGAWWPLEIVPDFMKVIGHLSPVAWAMDAFNEVIFYDGGFGQILLPVGVLLLASAVFFGIGMMNFEYE